MEYGGTTIITSMDSGTLTIAQIIDYASAWLRQEAGEHVIEWDVNPSYQHLNDERNVVSITAFKQSEKEWKLIAPRRLHMYIDFEHSKELAQADLEDDMTTVRRLTKLYRSKIDSITGSLENLPRIAAIDALLETL